MLNATPRPSKRGSAMMFSKLSGRPVATQMPSVTSPDSASGASVSITSVARRSRRAGDARAEGARARSVSNHPGARARAEREEQDDRKQRPQSRLQEGSHDG